MWQLLLLLVVLAGTAGRLALQLLGCLVLLLVVLMTV
jgi:hypothetical protein